MCIILLDCLSYYKLYMNNKIDKLKIDVDDIKKSLNELKNNVSLSEDEKKKQAENLKSKAETTKKEIEKEIHSLENKTDDESKKQKEEAETLLDSFNEIMSLYASILNSQESEEWEVEIQEEEKKGFFKKTKEWVWEQWDCVRDKEKWEEEWWKNLLRTAWFAVTWIWAGALIIKWIRKIFWRDYEKEIPWYKDMSRKEKREARKEYRKQKRKEKREKRKKEKESKSFWERPVGKAIKWTGIWTWIYYVIHGLKTGKWDLSHFFDWNKNSPSSEVEDVYNDYSEFAEKDPERYKEYEEIGENINLMYDQIWDTERNYFWDDSQVVMWEIWNQVEEKKLKKNEKFEHIDTKWMVVYSLDNFYTDVWQLLSYGGVEKYLRCKTIEEYKTKIKSFGAEWFDKAMVPFLSWFANFASFWIVGKDTAQQKMDKYFKWISENAWDSLYELDLFFRQYTKVLTYMADKKNAIALQEARKIISIQWYDWKAWPTDVSDQNDMLNEAINDRNWVEKNLKWTTYWAFMSSNILWASRILKNEWLDGSEMTEELESVVLGVDKQTEKIIWWFEDNALKKAESKLNNWESLDSNDKNGLHKIAQNIVDDMWDETKPWWIYNTFDYFFEAFDLWDSDKKMILEESWLSKCFSDIVSAIQKLQSEISVNPTKENIELLKNLVWQYTSLKKELAVAIYAIKEAKESKDWLDKLLSFGKLIWWFFVHFAWSMRNLFHLRADIWDFINIFAWLTVTWGIVEIAGRMGGKPWAIKLWKYTKKVWLLPCALIEMWLWHTNWWWAVKHHINDVAKTNPTKAENLMKKGILDWVLSPKQVGKILDKNPAIKNSLCIYTSESDEKMFKAVVDNIFGDTYKTQANLFVKYYDKINTNCLIDCINDNSVRWLKNKKFNVTIHEWAFLSLDNFDKEFGKLWSNTVQKSYFEAMLKKVNEGADIDLLTDLVKNENFRNAINGDNFKLLKKLRISELKELKQSGKLDDFINWKIKADEMMSSLKRFSNKVTSTVGETVENMSEARKTFNKCIDDAVKVIEQSWDPESVMVKEITGKLKELKKDTQLLDEEMECFTKFIDRWLEARYIPDLKKLLEITDVYEWEVIWKKFQKLLSDWNIDAFKGLLWDTNNRVIQKAIKNAGVKPDELLTCFKKVTKGMSGNEVKTLVKWFAKVISKIVKVL